MSKTSGSAFGTNSSIVVNNCQVCNFNKLESIIFLGYLPPVNVMNPIGKRPAEEPSYPAQLLYCPKCSLVQLGLIVDPKILFPYSYPYTSSTTKILRDNFSELYSESKQLVGFEKSDLVIDIGSNDGNLLINYKNHCRVLGITPERIGKEAIKRGIPTMIDYFSNNVVKKMLSKYGKAKIITATNVFAHIENVNEVLENIVKLLKKDGVFISESHYLYSLIQTLQYDTIYHEHIRYYSLQSLKYLLEKHGLEVFFAKQIPTHGGSIRVYATRKGNYSISSQVNAILKKERALVSSKKELSAFRYKVVLSKLKLMKLLEKIKSKNQKIYGISAPSRATTLINYTGINNEIIECVLEIKGSHKIGNYIPGTIIPIMEESILFKHQPEYALILSWHIASELIPKLREKGYKGKFIVPLPKPKIIS